MKIAVTGATGRLGRHVVEVLAEQGHEAIAIARSGGVDIVTGAGLAAALTGVEVIIDVASTPSPEQRTATEFFTAAARNLQRFGAEAGVRRLVVVSIIGIDGSTAGYNAAKLVHEQAVLAGPIPAQIVRSAQFAEFVGQLVQWGTRGDTASVPRMRTQLVAARSVAETLVDFATAADLEISGAPFPEVAGPREENLAEMARLLADRLGAPARIEEVSDPGNPDRDVFENGGLLPGPGAILAGPTYRQWLDLNHPAES
ncbi:SDR family oxidoreductase [Nocardia concava]|uniref:SDR family oxidoreductase n=1 Tax=Nocardia concava TaxID=257281 RepID=UPI0002D765F9|nr:NAD(P)H-binding protein [Nocardia concava]